MVESSASATLLVATAPLAGSRGLSTAPTPIFFDCTGLERKSAQLAGRCSSSWAAN